MQGLQAGDTGVLKRVYTLYSAALFGVITRMVNDDHLAEDILQEAFVKIWNNAGSYDKTKGRLFTWMLNICRNSAIDKLRSKGQRTAQKTVSDETKLREDPKETYDAIKPETIGVRDVVNALKPEWKEIIDLIYFQGFTHVEASEELGLPLGTVKTRLRSALCYLREHI